MKTALRILVLIAISPATNAAVRAGLVDIGGGMIYDDDLDLTWLQDANYAMTSGADADGLMAHDEANAFAQNLSYGGFNDWRRIERRSCHFRCRRVRSRL